VFHPGWRRRAAAARAILPPALVLLFLYLPAPVTGAEPPAASTTDIEVFVREGCPHCAAAKRFLDELQQERPGLRVSIRDIARDPEALVRLQILAAHRGVRTLGVPAFFLQGELLVGFASPETTGARLKELLDRPARDTLAAAPADAESIETRWFGRLSVKELGLPLFTLAIGVLDGFNPCSMWVLVLMISLLAGLRDRRKLALIAGTFVVVEGVAYFVFMAAWLNVFLLIGLSRMTEMLLGALACVAGAINIKDFWALGRGVTLAIPQSAKPGLYARLRDILLAENLTAALVGVVMLGVLVQVVELLCTSGFPALYTRILTMRHLEGWAYYGYLGLYDAAYMFDDVIVLTIGVITLSQRRLQEREGRWLKLISGAVMLGLGTVLILAPKWLMYM